MNVSACQSAWNTRSEEILQAEGKKTNVFSVYCASKIIAERAAWDFIEKEKPSFDFATVLPAFNFGPILHEVRSHS